MLYEVVVPQPNRKPEIGRSAEVDNTRAAVVDELCAKHGLKFAPWTAKGRRGIPAIRATHHGVTSVTFYTGCTTIEGARS